MPQVQVSDPCAVFHRGDDGDLIALAIEPLPDPQSPREIPLIIEPQYGPLGPLCYSLLPQKGQFRIAELHCIEGDDSQRAAGEIRLEPSLPVCPPDLWSPDTHTLRR